MSGVLRLSKFYFGVQIIFKDKFVMQQQQLCHLWEHQMICFCCVIQAYPDDKNVTETPSSNKTDLSKLRTTSNLRFINIFIQSHATFPGPYSEQYTNASVNKVPRNCPTSAPQQENTSNEMFVRT